jgi:LDH2 family malate/lactate/ureidoglycolate dehydrogenase
MASRYYANPAEARTFAKALLTKSGLPEDHAKLMAKCLVEADTRGVVCRKFEAMPWHFPAC